jgi:hypothetical protein
VECDGDFWHGPAQFEQDLARQRELERCGWEFFRVRESVFYADMPGTLSKLWQTLDELDIRTADWIDPTFDDDDGPEDEDEVEDAVGEDIPSEPDEAEHKPPSPSEALEQESELPRRENEPAQDQDIGRHRASTEEDSAGDQVEATETVDGHSDERDAIDLHDFDNGKTAMPEAGSNVVEHFSASASQAVQPYISFDERLPGIGESRLDTVSTNIARIVAVEGPVLGDRLHQAYAKAAGSQTTGKKIAHILNQAIDSAERRGMIVSDNPLNDAGVKPKTFRLADQPEVVARELGPRPLNLVPPAELAHHLLEVSVEGELRTEEDLFHAVLHRLGLERLTENAKAVFTRAITLAPLRESATESSGSSSIS